MINKTHALAGVIGAALAVGAPALYRAAVPAVSAEVVKPPIKLMWTDEGPGRPARAVLALELYDSPDAGDGKGTEFECDADGARPQVRNQLVAYDADYAKTCADIAALYTALQTDLAAIAPKLAGPVALADMAQSTPVVDAGQ